LLGPSTALKKGWLAKNQVTEPRLVRKLETTGGNLSDRGASMKEIDNFIGKLGERKVGGRGGRLNSVRVRGEGGSGMVPIVRGNQDKKKIRRVKNRESIALPIGSTSCAKPCQTLSSNKKKIEQKRKGPFLRKNRDTREKKMRFFTFKGWESQRKRAKLSPSSGSERSLCKSLVKMPPTVGGRFTTGGQRQIRATLEGANGRKHRRGLEGSAF